jgi:O-antigen ligase
MEFGDSQLFQLTVAAVSATVLFFGAYSLPQKAASTILIVLIPFQPIDTKYASANVVLTFVVFIAMLMRREEIRLPLMPQMLIVMFVYLISMGVQDPATYSSHAFYMVNLLAAFLVLWIAYDLTIRFQNIRGIVVVFLVMNVLVAIYCSIQLVLGPGHSLAFLGISEMSMLAARDDMRLTGPFNAVGIMAEYCVLMVFLILHQLLTASKKSFRVGLVVLMLVDLVFLVATGNRGGFLTLLGGGVLYLWTFRKVLGPGRTIGLASAALVLLSLSSIIAINFTQYDSLFIRLTETEVEEGIPDTRQNVWPVAWKEIKTHPFLGHGPRLRFEGEDDGLRYKGHKYIQYPHNLYLSQLFTVGILGTIAFLIFMITPFLRCWRTSNQPQLDLHAQTFAKTGIILMVVIFVDQMKVEFTRFELTDYWHFLFALFGVLIAVCDRARVAQNMPVQSVQREAPR